MDIVFEGVNWWPIIVAAVAAQILGALWYSPALFGNMWMKMVGLTKKDTQEKNMGMAFFLAFVGAIVTAFILMTVMKLVGATTLESALQTSFWLWLGFIAPVTLGAILWEGKPVKLYFLNNGYTLISLLITGAILASW